MIYNYSRKIHRLFMFLMILLTGVMWITGQVMEEGWKLIPVVQARIIHRLTSKVFTPVVLIMAITGLIMYFYPLLRRKKS